MGVKPLVLPLVLILSGCASTSVPEQMAYGVLFDATGKVDLAALTAALNSRFPAGTTGNVLAAGMNSMLGGCSFDDKGYVSVCSLPITGRACSPYISIGVERDGDFVRHLSAVESIVMCD